MRCWAGWRSPGRRSAGWPPMQGTTDARPGSSGSRSLERIKAAAAAAQAAGDACGSRKSQVAEQQTAGVDYRRLGKGIADQVGMATRTGPWHGARRLTMARDLWHELPGCFGLLAAGEISEHAASVAGQRDVASRSGDPPRRGCAVGGGAGGADGAHEQRRARPAGWPRPLTRPAVCSGPGSRGRTAGSVCGRCRTPWLG